MVVVISAHNYGNNDKKIGEEDLMQKVFYTKIARWKAASQTDRWRDRQMYIHNYIDPKFGNPALSPFNDSKQQ